MASIAIDDVRFTIAVTSAVALNTSGPQWRRFIMALEGMAAVGAVTGLNLVTDFGGGVRYGHIDGAGSRTYDLSYPVGAADLITTTTGASQWTARELSAAADVRASLMELDQFGVSNVTVTYP